MLPSQTQNLNVRSCLLPESTSCSISGLYAALLDATMTAAGFFVTCAPGGENGIIKEQRGILLQRPLIALESQNIIRFRVNDLSGDSLLCPHCVDGHDCG